MNLGKDLRLGLFYLEIHACPQLEKSLRMVSRIGEPLLCEGNVQKSTMIVLSLSIGLFQDSVITMS